MHNVTILKEAEAELVEVIEFYESKYQGLGKDFLKEVKSSIEIITING